MFETLKRLYLEKKLNDIGLLNAVRKGWITKSQEDEIKIIKMEV